MRVYDYEIPQKFLQNSLHRFYIVKSLKLKHTYILTNLQDLDDIGKANLSAKQIKINI